MMRAPARYVVAGIIDTDRCPVRLVTMFSRMCLSLHYHWRQGRMPASGGVLEQPTLLVAAFDALDGCLADMARG